MSNDLLPPDAPPAAREGEKPFLEHLEDLRRILIRAILVFAAALGVALPLALRGHLIALVKWPLVRAVGPLPAQALPTLSPGGGAAAAMRLAAEAGLVLSLPVVLALLGSFILPALTARERRYFRPVLAAGTGLFYAGMAFCWFLALPWALGFFWRLNRLMGVSNLWTINEYASFATGLLLAFGLVFEFPLLVLALVGMGMIRAEALSEKRRYAIVAIFIVAAVLTPPDAFTQLLMAAPLLVLYELSVWGARFMQRAGEGPPAES